MIARAFFILPTKALYFGFAVFMYIYVHFTRLTLQTIYGEQKQERSGMSNQHLQAGYTLIELLLAVVVGSIIIAATYTSYALIAKQYNVVSAHEDTQSMAIPTLRIIERDLRMAGYKELNDELDAPFGSIFNPVDIIDSQDACCDRLTVVYDESLTRRVQRIYEVKPRTNPDRNALYLHENIWDGNAWTPEIQDALVADYIEDFQADVSVASFTGRPKLVDIKLVTRNQTALPDQRSFSNSSNEIGNYNMSVTDNYMRQSYVTSVMLRNIK